MIEIDVIEIEGSTVAVIELPTEIPVEALARISDGCVPAWLVFWIVVALAGRELLRWSKDTPPRRES